MFLIIFKAKHETMLFWASQRITKLVSKSEIRAKYKSQFNGTFMVRLNFFPYRKVIYGTHEYTWQGTWIKIKLELSFFIWSHLFLFKTFWSVCLISKLVLLEGVSEKVFAQIIMTSILFIRNESYDFTNLSFPIKR